MFSKKTIRIICLVTAIAMVSRFVGDVDMVENLFTSGIISMFAGVN